jgi:hypothetical protein
LARRDSYLSDNESHKIFNPYLVDSIFILPLQLYGEYGKQLELIPEFRGSTIYFIVKRKKLRFVLNEVMLEDNLFKFTISVSGQQVLTHQIPLTRLLTGEDKPETIEPIIIPVLSFFHLRLLEPQYYPYPIVGVSIDKSKSNEKILSLKIWTSDGKSNEKPIFPYALMHSVGAGVDDFSEILYIGKSLNMKKRTLVHKKIQQALAEVDETEDDIYIYFFTLREQRVLLNAGEYCKRLGSHSVLGSRTFGDMVEITDEGRTNLVEMALINYFIPKYNDHHTKSQIPLNQQVKDLLKANNYTILRIDISFDDDVFMKFGSAYVKPKQHHTIDYSL